MSMNDTPTAPTAQEVADALAIAFDATTDLIEMLDQSAFLVPGFDKVAIGRLFQVFINSATSLQSNIVTCLADLPDPAELRHGDEFHEFDDIPF